MLSFQVQGRWSWANEASTQILAIDEANENELMIWTRDTRRVVQTAGDFQEVGADTCYPPSQIQEWFGNSVPW